MSWSRQAGLKPFDWSLRTQASKVPLAGQSGATVWFSTVTRSLVEIYPGKSTTGGLVCAIPVVRRTEAARKGIRVHRNDFLIDFLLSELLTLFTRSASCHGVNSVGNPFQLLSRKSWFPLSGRNIAEQPRSNPQAAAKLLTFLGSTPTSSRNGRAPQLTAQAGGRDWRHACQSCDRIRSLLRSICGSETR